MNGLTKEIKESKGFKTLLDAIKKDCNNCKHDPIDCLGLMKDCQGLHKYAAKLTYVIDKATHYSKKTELSIVEIIDAWENNRNYWYMNYYQDSNQPDIKGDVFVYKDKDEFQQKHPEKQFICPLCDCISSNPYECDSGAVKSGKKCDWKSYGLFGTLGKGITVVLKHPFVITHIFRPVNMINEKGGDKKN